jgi:hypothetical protein
MRVVRLLGGGLPLGG